MDSIVKGVGEFFKAAVFMIVLWVIGAIYLGYWILLPFAIIATIGLIFIRPFLRNKLSFFEAIFSLLKYFVIGSAKLSFLAIPIVPLFYLIHMQKLDYATDPENFWNIATCVFLIFDVLLFIATLLFAEVVKMGSYDNPIEQFKDALRGRY